MFRTLFKLLLLLIVLVGVGGFVLGWWATGARPDDGPDQPVGTAGPVSPERARETGAEVGERAADAANQAKRALDNGAITAKIKSKMALDDTVEARRIDVDTANGIVTLSGTVDTEAQRQRALQLARETEGVREVVDRLRVRD